MIERPQESCKMWCKVLQFKSCLPEVAQETQYCSVGNQMHLFGFRDTTLPTSAWLRGREGRRVKWERPGRLSDVTHSIQYIVAAAAAAIHVPLQAPEEQVPASRSLQTKIYRRDKKV